MGASYLKALQLQKKLEEKARQEAENRKKAKEGLDVLDKKLEEFKKADIKIDEAEEIRKKIDELMAAKEYSEALSLIKKAEEALEKAKVEQLDNMISAAEEMIVLSKTMGADTSKAEDLLEKTKKALEEGASLKDMVKMVRDAWGEAERVLQEKISGAFSAAQSLIIRVKDLGKDVGASENLFQEARSLADRGEYKEALDKLAECVDLLGSRVREYVEAIKDDINEYVAIAEENDVDVKDLREKLGELDELMEEAEYERAIETARLLKDSAEKAIVDDLNKRIKKIEKVIKEGEEIEVNVEQSRHLLAEAKKAVRNKNFRDAIDIIKSAHDEIHEACFQKVLKIISESRGNFLEAKKLGADLSHPLEILNRARTALRQGEYKKAVEYAKQGDREVEEIVKNFKKAQESLSRVEENMNLAEELGIDTVFSQQLVEEARKSLQQMNFQKALDLINKSREKIEAAEQEKVMDIIERAEISLTLAEKVGVDTKDFNEKMERAIEALRENRFKEAYTLATETKTKIDEAVKLKILEMVEMARAKAHNLGVGEEGDVAVLLDATEKAIEEDSVEMAYKHINAAMEAIESVQRERVERIINEAREGIEVLEEVGADVSKYLPGFHRASSLLKEKEYEAAEEEAKNCLQRVLEGAKESFEELFSNAKLAAVEARRKGINIDEVKKRLEEARDAFAAGDYKTAIQKAIEARETAQELKKRYEEAYRAITEVAALVTDAKKDGIDVKPVVKLLVQAKKSLEEQQFDKAMKISLACKESLEKIKDQYSAAKKIVMAQKLITTAEKMEVDVSDIKETLREAKGLMKGKKFKEASRLAESVLEKLEERIESKVVSLITLVEDTVEDAKSIGINVENVTQLVDSAKEFLKDEKYFEAYEEALKAKKEIERLRRLSQEAVIKVQELKDLISNAQSIGAKVEPFSAKVDEAINLIKDNKYEEALSLLEKTKDDVIRVQRERVESVLASFEEAISKAKDKMDTSSSEKLLAEAREKLENGEYREALNLAMKSEGELEKASLQHKMAKESIEAAREKVKAIEKKGVPPGKAVEVLKEAEKAFKDKDYVKALSLSVEAGELAHEIEMAHEGTREEIEKARNRIASLKEQGADVSDAEAVMSGALREFERQEYGKAKQYAQKAVKEAEEKYHAHVGNLLEEIKKSFKEVEERGGSTERPNHLLEEAKKALEAHEYTKVFTLLDKIKVVLKYEMKGAIRKRISMLEVSVEEAKRKGLDTSKVEDIIHDAIYKLENDEYDEALRLTEEAEKILAGAEEERKELEDVILAAESIVNKAKKYGIDMKKVKEMLAEAIRIKDEDLEQALNLAETARDEAERIFEEFRPIVAPELRLGDVFAGEWVHGELVLTNTGRALGKDLTPRIAGEGVEIRGLKKVPMLRSGGSERIPIQLLFKKPGPTRLVISGDVTSVVDGKTHPFEKEVMVEVREKLQPKPVSTPASVPQPPTTPQPAAPQPVPPTAEKAEVPEETSEKTFERIKADAVYRCKVCNGKIKEGMIMIKCSCGATFHEPCANRAKKCPVCGKPISGGEPKKKKAIKLG